MDVLWLCLLIPLKDAFLFDQIGFARGLSYFCFTGNLSIWHNQLEVLFPTHLMFKLLHSWIAGACFLILGVVLLFTCPDCVSTLQCTMLSRK